MSNKKVAGEIITVGDTPVAIVGETLADILNLDNWTEIDNGKVVNPGKGPSTIIVGKSAKSARS